MATEFTLHLNTPMAPGAIISAIHDCVGDTLELYKPSNPNVVAAGVPDGLTITACRLRGRAVQSTFEKAVDASLLINFRMGKGDSPSSQPLDEQYEWIVIASLAVSALPPRLALFHIGHETPLFERRGDVLRVNSAASFWRPERLRLIDESYELTPLEEC